MPYPASRKDVTTRYNDLARHEAASHNQVRKWSNSQLAWLREAEGRYPVDDPKVQEALQNVAAQFQDTSVLEDRSRERMHTLRLELQKRYNEETTLLSWAKPGPGRAAKQLPREICEKIAGLNNRTADWDTPLTPPTIYPDKTRPRPTKTHRHGK